MVIHSKISSRVSSMVLVCTIIVSTVPLFLNSEDTAPSDPFMEEPESAASSLSSQCESESEPSTSDAGSEWQPGEEDKNEWEREEAVDAEEREWYVEKDYITIPRGLPYWTLNFAE